MDVEVAPEGVFVEFEGELRGTRGQLGERVDVQDVVVGHVGYEGEIIYILKVTEGIKIYEPIK